MRRFSDYLQLWTKKLSRKNLYEYTSEILLGIPEGARVLNVGSGGQIESLLMKHARNQKFEVISLDIDPKRHPDIVGDICNVNFNDKSFDYVVMCEVLEHVHSPHVAIENIHQMLKTGGGVIMSTPFMLPMHDRPYDYFRYTRYGLELLLKKFQDVKIRERNSYFEAIDVLWVRLWQTNVSSAKILCYFIIPWIYIIKKPATWLLTAGIKTDAMTTGYVVTARKK
jgi:SAM-dependent methyltransferase